MTAGPQIGIDEWASVEEERRIPRSGLGALLEPVLGRVPWWALLGVFLALCCLVPVASDSGYVRRVAFDTTLYMLLALGLNVVVGWGGLLDLGYVAFYGFGAYSYALLGSEQFDVHVPTVVAIPLVVLGTGLVGYLLGLTSWRLVGDYLAIVTLFFGQIFLTVAVNGDKILGENVTNGSQGISNVDPLSFFGHDLPVSHEGVFNVAYLYVALAVFAVVFVALRFLNESRIGRAWRALREDPLAAQLMSMPVDRLKLLAFAFGAGTAGLTGSLFASLNAGVFPENFALPLLITIYAMVILGGAGSQAGVVLGAIAVNVMLEALRSSDHARWVFYAAIVACLLVFVRPWARVAIVLAATTVLGFVVHALAGAVDSDWTGGAVQGSDAVARAMGHWALIPESLGKAQEVSYVGLLVAVLVVTTLRGWVRLAVLVPTLYLAAFVWENVMARDPASTRFVLLGVLLVGVMTTRPSGLLGESRVEIV
jgi:ABC-type branched-subunit amino acid transport system permease subunit